MNIKTTLGAAALTFALLAGHGQAKAAEGIKIPTYDWSFDGIFGTFDHAALQRGFQVFKEVCANCHAFKHVAFRNLEALGYSKAEVKAIAAQYQIKDGPNDDGDMFERPGKPSDYWPSPFANDKAAAAANGGAVPPDLSEITKARGSGADSALRISLMHPAGFPLGADYVHALLNGFVKAPAGFKVPDGKYYNEYFPGHNISMPPPLAADGVEYADGTKATVEQMSKDVVEFLVWASEPELEARKNLGVKVMLFLIAFSVLLYGLKRKIWSDIH